MATSITRTLVPFLVALIGPWVLSHLGVGEEALTSWLTVVLGAIYYVAVRALEERWPQAGWLLGAPGAPTYDGRHEAGTSPTIPTGPGMDGTSLPG